MSATRHFTFDLTGALAQQLEEVLPSLRPAALDEISLAEVDHLPGVYQLYLAGDLVYVGKADRDLRGRLFDHLRKIGGRLNISLSDMAFTGIYLEGTWIPVGPEQMLIRRFARQGLKPHWNDGGFGINDPGRQRDTTNFGQSHFDVQYPVDLDVRVSVDAGVHAVKDFLPLLKRSLPYTFRFEDQHAKHADYLSSRVHVEIDRPTADQAFRATVAGLPTGWQLTVLPGYAILYQKIADYPSARRVYRS